MPDMAASSVGLGEDMAAMAVPVVGSSSGWILARMRFDSSLSVRRQLVGIRSRSPIRMTVRRPSELALWMAAMLVP